MAAWLAACLLILPLLVVAATLTLPRGDLWQHLWETLLGELLLNTGLLLGGVALGTTVLGTTLAWLVTAHRFPGRRLFDHLLVLPMAMPAYVVGFVVVAQLEFTGPVQSAWRGWFGDGGTSARDEEPWGVIVTMCLVLYPYVYLLARAAFADMSASLLEAGRSLGCSSRRLFWRVAMPSARPAIATGVALALMEALADFGTVSLFNVHDLHHGDLRVWFGMFDREAGSQLASLLLVTALDPHPARAAGTRARRVHAAARPRHRRRAPAAAGPARRRGRWRTAPSWSRSHSSCLSASSCNGQRQAWAEGRVAATIRRWSRRR